MKSIMKKGKSNKYLPLFVLLLSIGQYLHAQTFADSINVKYRFIKPQLNTIENDTIGLKDFYEKLYMLQMGKQERISVLHIGDSHIQADFFSGIVRQKMQQNFGNAGRGLVFPYRVARTNEPSSFESASNIKWESKRNIFPDLPLPIGIGGITLRTTDTSAFIRLNVYDQGGLQYEFNKMTLFQDKGPAAFDFIVSKTGNGILGFINSNLLNEGTFTSAIEFDRPQKNITIKAYQRDSAQTSAQLYGLLLENGQRGVLYNATGVNGAQCWHCTRSEYFFQQLPVLNPDLIIISYGTNEAYSKGFNKEKFYADVDSLVKEIRKVSKASILFTTPADSYRKVKYKNSDMRHAKESIIQYCLNNNLAYWDLYEIMGGFGSMSKWKLAGLAAPDKVHFSRAGYEIQGKLLYQALIDGFNNYKKLRHY